jgi:hypothetical protein
MQNNNKTPWWKRTRKVLAKQMTDDMRFFVAQLNRVQRKDALPTYDWTTERLDDNNTIG